jgi:hypothetical protein
MTIKTTAASQLSPFMVGLPAWQEIQRGREIRMDPKRADIIDMMFPTQGSPNRQYNFLSDELGPGTLQQMTQTLTGGSYWLVDPSKLDEDRAYQVFRNIDYRPSPIERQKGVLIDGAVRPLTDEEYAKAQMMRGRMLKEEVAKLDPNTDPALLTRQVSRRAAITKKRALNAIKAEAVGEEFEDKSVLEAKAQELHGEIFSLPPEQRLRAYNEALASGRVQVSESGEINPDFLAKWNQLTQPAQTP